MSLRKRIQIILAFLVLIPLVLLMYQSYRASRSSLVKQIKQGSLQIARLETAEIGLIFEPPRLVVEELVRSLETKKLMDPGDLQDLMHRTLVETPEIFGIAVAFDPESTTLRRFAHYCYRPGGTVRERSMVDPANDYTKRGWYRLPMDTGKAGWTGAYFDEGGGDTLMITFTAPIRFDGRIVGVAEVDLDLDGLVQKLQAIKPGGDGTVFLVNRFGQILAHPNLKTVTEMDVAQELAPLAELMNRAGVDCIEMADPVSRIKSWVVETPIPSLSAARGGQDWSLIVSWPMHTRLAPLGGVTRRILVLYLFLGGASFLFLNRSLDRIITRPLSRLTEQARRYAAGDFSPPPPMTSDTMELQELSRALDSLGAALTGKAKENKS